MAGVVGGLRSIQIPAADASRTTEPTPAATARPPLKAFFAAVTTASAWSAGSCFAASMALGSESSVCEVTASEAPGGIANAWYTPVTMEPSVAMPSAMPSS